MSTRKRLHISPLSKELLSAVLGSQLLSIATNISFHTIPAYPDKPYGFVELPEMDATRLQKKLDGTILRGKKVKIGEAREDTRRYRSTELEQAQEEEAKPRELRKSKRKREDKANVVPGYELPANRKVKRGWAEPKIDSKEQKKRGSAKVKDAAVRKAEPSKFTKGSECLFQTNLPPTSLGIETNDTLKRKKGKGNKIVVHEFEKTQKHPKFLRNGDLGQDIESEPKAATNPASAHQVADHDSSEDEIPNRRSSPSVESEPRDLELPGETNRESFEEQDSPSPARTGSNESTEVKGASRNYLPTLELTQSSPTTTEPHPLETLFKRPKPPTSTPTASQKPDLQVKVPFSFFGEEAEDESVEKSLETPGLPKTRRNKAAGLPNLSIPVTPYTQRDMSWRSQRSAAPTPDTAAPGKSGFGDVWNRLHEDREDDIEEADEENNSGEEGHGDSMKKEESEFTKWFWAHRGENNRAWKKRRREAAKEQRQKENKRRRKAT